MPYAGNFCFPNLSNVYKDDTLPDKKKRQTLRQLGLCPSYNEHSRPVIPYNNAVTLSKKIKYKYRSFYCLLAE